MVVYAYLHNLISIYITGYYSYYLYYHRYGYLHRYYSCQWRFQEPKLEVPTIYKAYTISGLHFRGYPHNSYGQKYGTNVPPSVGS